MPSAYTSSQKSAIAQFVSFTSTKDSVAAKQLKAHGWNIQQAVDAGFHSLTAAKSTTQAQSTVEGHFRDDMGSLPLGTWKEATSASDNQEEAQILPLAMEPSLKSAILDSASDISESMEGLTRCENKRLLPHHGSPTFLSNEADKSPLHGSQSHGSAYADIRSRHHNELQAPRPDDFVYHDATPSPPRPHWPALPPREPLLPPLPPPQSHRSAYPFTLLPQHGKAGEISPVQLVPSDFETVGSSSRLSTASSGSTFCRSNGTRALQEESLKEQKREARPSTVWHKRCEKVKAAALKADIKKEENEAKNGPTKKIKNGAPQDFVYFSAYTGQCCAFRARPPKIWRETSKEARTAIKRAIQKAYDQAHEEDALNQAYEEAYEGAEELEMSFREFISLCRDERARKKAARRRRQTNVSSNLSFFNGSNGSSSTTSLSTSSLNKVFDSYRDNVREEPDRIGVDGSMRYLQDLGVKLDEPAVLAVLTELNAPVMGEFTRDGFIDGWNLMRADTLAKQQQHIPTLRRSLATNPALFKKTYKQSFILARAPGSKVLPLDVAIEHWRLLLSPPSIQWSTQETPWLNWWIEFLEQRWKKAVNKDMWDQTAALVQKSKEDETLSWWNEDGAWPSVIDDFVAYVKEKRGSGEEMDVG